jgi:hypothetical protein
VKWLLILVALAGCKKSSDTQTEPGDRGGPPVSPVPAMPASEIKRGQDACHAYVAQVCACAETVPAMTQPCALSRALPDAIQVDLDVAANPESSRRDALQAQDSARKIVKECIEEIARLPSAGCP